nr:MAG TPA: hypothetical protein [Caudoviricetes sp.]
MTLWMFALVYLFVGCVRTAYMLADSAVKDEPKEVKVTAQEIGFNVIFWGINVLTIFLGNLIITVYNFGGDDE